MVYEISYDRQGSLAKEALKRDDDSSRDMNDLTYGYHEGIYHLVHSARESHSFEPLGLPLYGDLVLHVSSIPESPASNPDLLRT